MVVLENQLVEPGGIELKGVPIDLRSIKTPAYILSTKDDHIAPWVSCYPVTQVFSGPVRFVLGASGHIAGVINPPAANKYCYWINQKFPETPMEWFEAAKQHPGSWWTDWDKWVRKFNGGKKVAARQPGEGLEILEDAPGSYAKLRIS